MADRVAGRSVERQGGRSFEASLLFPPLKAEATKATSHCLDGSDLVVAGNPFGRLPAWQFPVVTAGRLEMIQGVIGEGSAGSYAVTSQTVNPTCGFAQRDCQTGRSVAMADVGWIALRGLVAVTEDDGSGGNDSASGAKGIDCCGRADRSDLGSLAGRMACCLSFGSTCFWDGCNARLQPFGHERRLQFLAPSRA